MGQLTFSYYGIGDSEINYNREIVVDGNPTDITLSASTKILRPLDKQPNIKYFITPLGAVTPYQVLDSGSLNVIKATVNNEATERGFFSTTPYTTLTGSTYSPHSQVFSNSYLTGGTVANGFASTTNFSVGDLVLIKLDNNSLSGQTLVNTNTTPIPNLWYKIVAVGPTSITVDRNLPNYSNQTTYNSELIVYKSGEIYNTIATGNTTAYWDSGTLSFDSASNVTCHDVPVWNMNNVWCENIAGITGLTTTNLYEDYTKFGSYQYLGLKAPYLGYLCETDLSLSATSICNTVGLSYDDDVSKSISIIHYTNNSISSLYGEFLYIDTTNNKTVKITLPDLMYHRSKFATASGTTMGMSFIASGNTQYVTNTNIEYIDLIEDPTLVSNIPAVIGRVYPQLKTIVIHNDEIVSAMSYKSNRNWTLPRLAATVSSPSGGTSTGVLAVNSTIYLTYSLENTISGLTTSLPCQDYVKLTNTTNGPKDIAFRISETDLLPYMRKKELIDYDGLGFYANKFKLLYQIVTDENTRPDPGAWKSYDFTSNAITGGISQTINPKLLENQTPTITGFILDTIKDSGSTTFDLIQTLNLAPNSSPSSLQFGDERFFYGNLTTHIGATIFKTIFDIRINSGLFNATTNPTRSKDTATNPPNIKVSEVGIYDNNKNLVCIGKLSKPVALLAGDTIMIELSLDF